MPRAARKAPSAAVPRACLFWAWHRAIFLMVSSSVLPMGSELALYPGLVTWGSAGCPANGRVGVQIDVQTCRPFPQQRST